MYLWLAVLFAVLASIKGSDVCDVTFEKVGCFKDSLANRRLPNFLITDRDHLDKERFGKYFDWDNFQGSARSLLCRCSSKARSLGYRYIGIQFFAECWAGNSCLRALSYGPSQNCTQSVAKSKEVCNFDHQDDCVGKGYTNFIYELLDCSEMVDIAVLLDVSTSTSMNGGLAAKKLLKKLVELLHISRQGTHISLVTFTQTASLAFDFTSHYNKEADITGLKAFIDHMQSVGGSTWPNTALDMANDHLFLDNGGSGRRKMPGFVITITDGHIHQGSIITPVLHKLKGKGVNLLSVGVGSNVNNAELGYLTLSNKQNVFDGNHKTSAENIAKRIQALAKDECAAADCN